MSVQFYPLRVRDLRQETADTVSVLFEVPNGKEDVFRFVQGQYLTLRTQLDGEEVRRSYSICAGVQEGELRVAVKKLEGGRFSTFVNEKLQVGDVLDVMPPEGNFHTPLDPTRTGSYVAFAAGSGITPIMSILKSTLALEPKSRFFLFYGNRGFEHIIFREELEMLKNRYPDRFAIYHVLSREALPAEIFCGRLSADKCRSYAMRLFDPAEVDAFFLCGPEQMVLELRETLEKDLAVPAKRIHIELFNAPSVQRKITKVANPTFTAAVTVIQDGYEFDFELPDKGSSLLDAAMRAGADLPFSCKGGVCCTCKAKVLEGAVDMDINYGLEPDEIEAGYILTCQSHPKTERLVVSFDE